MSDRPATTTVRAVRCPDFFIALKIHSMKRFFAITMLLAIIAQCEAQKFSDHYIGLQNPAEGPEIWKAKWIWLPHSTREDKNVFMQARQTFELSEMPDTAVVYITADSHFKLWVNGQFVRRGPARCNPHHQSYDIIDLSEYLSPGKNTIAVLVHYHGVMRSYYSEPYPGLLVQVELGTGSAKRYVVSDRDWRVRRDYARDTRNEWVNRVNANNFSSCTDFRRAVVDWQLVSFDDQHWSRAVYQTGPATWPPKSPDYEPYAVQKPWYSLVARDLPALKERNLAPVGIWKLLESPQYSKYPMWEDSKPYDALHHSMQDVYLPLQHSDVTGAEGFPAGIEPLIIRNAVPEGKFIRAPLYHTTVVFDFGKIIKGYPYLKVSGGPGSVIDVNYVPYLVDSTFLPALQVNNWSDRLILSGNDDRWEATELRQCRYMSVTIRGDMPVSVSKAGIRAEEYPFRKKGIIEVPDDPFIADFWHAAEETIKGITTDGFTDNYHENRQYVQTSFYASRGNYASFGDPWLQRRYLLQHAQDQLPNGIMPMWAPWGVYEGNRQVPGIFEANHFWLMGLHDYFLFTGDTITTRSLLSNAERCAVAINGLQHEQNLLHKPPYPYWIDWARLAQGDKNFILNALQLKAFQDYARLLRWLQADEMARRWESEAQSLKLALKNFWSPGAQLFSDNLNAGGPDQNFSEHANALAIVTGVADSLQTASILRQLIDNSGGSYMEQAVLFNYWVAEALCMHGYGTEAINLLKQRYSHMVYDDEIGTLWEYANIHAQNIGTRGSNGNDRWEPRSWSAMQAENTFPASILSQYVLGLRPVAPGCSEVLIGVMDMPYNRYSGALPVPGGELTVSRNANLIELSVPQGTSVILRLKELHSMKVQSLVINREQFQINGFSDDVRLPQGKYRIVFQKQ